MYGEGEQKACYVQAAMTSNDEDGISTNTFVVNSKKHRAETSVICKIHPEVILNKKGRLSKFT